jgi:hypothetical protein
MRMEHSQQNQRKHNLYLIEIQRHLGIKNQNDVVLMNLLNIMYKYI